VTDTQEPADIIAAENAVEAAIEQYLTAHGQLRDGEVLTAHAVITRVTSYKDGRPVTRYGWIPSNDLDTAGQLGLLEIAKARTQRNLDS
jgi:hypothetical protein